MTPSLVRPFWFFFSVASLALCWILPNHAPPWLTFHADAWAAIVLAILSAYVLLKTPFRIEWHGVTLITLAMLAIVVLQYALGLIHSFGVAWINMAYLLGLLVAVLAGSAWERVSRLQCADFLFASVVVGALVSVGLQFHQWLGLEPIGPWILMSSGARYSANLAQPNQLASLLFLGVLGCAWLNRRGWMPAYLAILMAMYFLFGLALTESRTAWINAAFIVSTLIAGRRLPGFGRLPPVAAGLSVFYIVCILTLPVLNELFGSSGMPVELRSMSDSVRLKLWTTLIEAASLRPWFGFGWGQAGHAQFLMHIDQLIDGGTLQSAHNLVLDLVLWSGIPIGLLVSAVLTRWVWIAIRRVADVFQVMMLLFLAVLTIHAMLEYPLQYAYFLLPAGMMLGALNSSLNFRVFLNLPKWTGVVSILVVSFVLIVTIRDYMRVETSFYGLRFEQRKIQTDIPATPPDVLVLTQWFDYLTFVRMDPAQVHDDTTIMWADNLVKTMPSALGIYKLAAMMAFAGRADEAQHWQRVLCKVNLQEQCLNMKNAWATDAKKYPLMAATPWVGGE